MLVGVVVLFGLCISPAFGNDSMQLGLSSSEGAQQLLGMLVWLSRRLVTLSEVPMARLQLPGAIRLIPVLWFVVPCVLF